MVSFNQNCASGIKVNKDKMQENLDRSLMLVTALNDYIGYENAAKVAKHAFAKNISLREAVLELKLMDPATFDQAMQLDKMV